MKKYKIHKGEIIKIGRIILKIRDIIFEKKNIIKCKKTDKNLNKIKIKDVLFEKKNNININSLDNNINNLDTSRNINLILKDFTDESLIKRNDLNNQHYDRIVNMVNQRCATDSDLKDKIEILTLDKNKLNITTNNTSTEETLSENRKNKIKEKLCRICYMAEEDKKDNPIIQPCKCSGSCKYVHLNCLKQWINTKSIIKVDKNKYCSVFIFTGKECEVCKTKLPDLIEHNGYLYSLLDFSKEFKNYFILECLTLDGNNNKFLYVISLDTNCTMQCGRGQSTDILLSDVSVSRVHFNFIIEGNNIFIKDNNSKYGTLILVQTPSIKLIEDLPLFIQVGRTFLKFLIKSNDSFGCCDVSENPNFLYYYLQNEKEIETKKFLDIKTEEDDDEYEEENSENKNEESNRYDIEEIINETIK